MTKNITKTRLMYGELFSICIYWGTDSNIPNDRIYPWAICQSQHVIAKTVFGTEFLWVRCRVASLRSSSTIIIYISCMISLLCMNLKKLLNNYTDYESKSIKSEKKLSSGDIIKSNSQFNFIGSDDSPHIHFDWY